MEKQNNNQAGLSIYKRIAYFMAGLAAIIMTYPLGENLEVYMKGGPVGIAGRWSISGFGFLLMLYSFFCKQLINPKEWNMYEETICPTCTRVYEKGRGRSGGKCQDCDVYLEPLKGFYDRHPKLRDVEENIPDKIEDLK